MEPLMVGSGSEQAGVLYFLGVLSIMLAGLVLIIRTKGLFILLLLLGIVAVAIGSLSPGGRSDTEPIPISPVEQQLNVIRRQIEPCWHIPAGTRDVENLVIYIAVVMNPDGTVRRAEIVDRARVTRDPIFRAVAASALRAVIDPQCSPLKLPPQKYQQWKNFTLSFNPKELP